MGRAARKRDGTRRQAGLTVDRDHPVLLPVDPSDASGLVISYDVVRGPWALLGESLQDAGGWIRRAQEDEAQGVHWTAVQVSRLVHLWVPDLVVDARAQGASWSAIGEAHGITRQSAWERFGSGSS